MRFLALLLLLVSPLRAVPEWQPVKADRVVFVHGIWQNESRCFGHLRRKLESCGVECIAPSLLPSDGRDGIEALAQQLKEAIEFRFPQDERFVLVGFSMGGLVARHYLQDLGGVERCDGLVTISTPHHGTRMAYLYFGKGAAEMRPGSVFLSDLHLGQDRLGKLPIISYRTPSDLVILPSTSSIWNLAWNIEIPAIMHQTITASPALMEDFMKRFEFPRE